jgi:hypothetical protein
MTIASSPTPWSDHCPKCAAGLPHEPDAMFGELTCVQCGGHLWFLYLEPQLRVYDFQAAARIRARVEAFIAEQLKMDPRTVVDSTFHFDELGTDSLDTIELVLKLEQEINSL